MKTRSLNKTIFLMFWLVWIFLLHSPEIIAEEKIKATLVKEIELSEEANLIFFNFDEVQNPRPKIEVHDQKIIFYDDEGSIIATKEYKDHIWVSASENKKFLQVWRRFLPPNKSKTGINTVDVLDDRGNTLWSKDFVSYPEGLNPHLILSNRGTAVKVLVDSNKLVFCDINGNEVNEVDFHHDIRESRGESVEVFSNNGNRFVFGLAYRFQPLTPKDIDRNRSTSRKIDKYNILRNMKSDVITFTTTGEELWRFKMEAKRVNKIFLSPDDQYIVCTGTGPGIRDKTTYFLDMQKGEMLFQEKGIEVHQIEFFEQNANDYAVLNDLSNRLVYINLSTKKIESTYTLSTGKKILVLALDEISQRVGLIEAQVGYEPMHRGQRIGLSTYILKMFDLSGNLLAEGPIPVESMGFLQRDDFIKLANGTLIMYLSRAKKLRIFNVSN